MASKVTRYLPQGVKRAIQVPAGGTTPVRAALGGTFSKKWRNLDTCGSIGETNGWYHNALKQLSLLVSPPLLMASASKWRTGHRMYHIYIKIARTDAAGGALHVSL